MDAIVYDKVGKEAEKIRGALYGIYPQATVTDAAIASFDDGADDIPVKALTVAIEPVQDLHGYDHPWPAGGGKNKFDPSTAQYNTGIAYADGIWTFEPVDEEAPDELLKFPFADTSYVGEEISVSFDIWGSDNATIKFDGQPDSVHTSGTAFSDKTINLTTTKQRLSYSGTYLENTTSFRLFRISSFNGASTANIYVSNIQIEIGAPTSYAPYSNICPITGFDSVKVSRTGKNLFSLLAENTNNIITGIETQTGVVSVADISTVQWAQKPLGYTDVVKGQTYTISGVLKYGRIGGSKSQSSTPYTRNFPDTSAGESIGSAIRNDIPTRTFIANESVRIYWYYCTDNKMSNHQAFTMTPVVNLGTSATTFEPFAGNNIYDITLPAEAGTVYGGTLDVTTGVLTVDRVKQTYTWSDRASTGQVLGSYERREFQTANKSTTAGYTAGKKCSIAPYLPNYIQDSLHFYIEGSNKQIFLFLPVNTSGDTQFEVLYPLETPVTYTLTPTEITTLLGQNYVFADTGNIKKLTYRADLGKYIDSHITTAVADALNA